MVGLNGLGIRTGSNYRHEPTGIHWDALEVVEASGTAGKDLNTRNLVVMQAESDATFWLLCYIQRR